MSSNKQKFSYRNKELLWLKVDKFENNYYSGYVDNKPESAQLQIKRSLYVINAVLICKKWVCVNIKKQIYVISGFC